ncbi:hypothetical protein HL667_14640 [Bradyrhizobium sp. 83012]|uniref:HEPN AbiU2-like domain-containing protein n=1 Tax=Bradyrhizobium aeschynomenes TaxID=2734909 RepID=A0ABX2CDD3_9BRAD|nr:hypothetical protein [Bradyrhizobium aeschynomenes]NPU66239.1 hypothetical protein [Bradyrhizobium aeschynomenes]
MEKKIRGIVARERWVYVHNDLSNAAFYFAEVIKKKQESGEPGILIDGLACATMIAFSFEAHINFMGFKLHEAGKLPEWKEREWFKEKLRKVFGALGIPIEKERRPLKSMEKMKNLRDLVAHGKPVYDKLDQEMIGTDQELEQASSTSLLAGWESECKANVVFECREDLEQLWKLMVEKSGLELFDTMTHGNGSIQFVEHVDPSTPSTVPKQI